MCLTDLLAAITVRKCFGLYTGQASQAQPGIMYYMVVASATTVLKVGDLSPWRPIESPWKYIHGDAWRCLDTARRSMKIHGGPRRSMEMPWKSMEIYRRFVETQ